MKLITFTLIAVLFYIRPQPSFAQTLSPAFDAPAILTQEQAAARYDILVSVLNALINLLAQKVAEQR